MKILLVEDDPFKGKALESFLSDLFSGQARVHVARSVAGALRCLEDTSGQYDLVCLDMSLPTFDIGAHEPGGRPQGFGGVNILRELDVLDSTAKVVVVTQFEEFTDSTGPTMKLSDLGQQLKTEFPSLFLGWVHFDHGTEKWKSSLRELLVGVRP